MKYLAPGLMLELKFLFYANTGGGGGTLWDSIQFTEIDGRWSKIQGVLQNLLVEGEYTECMNQRKGTFSGYTYIYTHI